MDQLILIALIATASIALLVSIVTAIVLWRAAYGVRAARLEARLTALHTKGQGDGARIKRLHTLSRFDGLDTFLKKNAFARWLDQQNARAGLSVRFDTVVGIWLFIFVFLFIILILFDASVYAFLSLPTLMLLLPWLLLKRLMRGRKQLFEEQLPDVLDFISRAMQAGHAFSSALQVAAEESPEPTAGEFLKTLNEINFGTPIDTALKDLSQRIDSADMKFFSVAVVINREVGGDLAALLDNLSSLIRARISMRSSIRAMTAEGRFSAWLLSAMPFLVAFVIFILRPEFLYPLWLDPIGIKLLWWALSLMLIGMLWMRRIANIHV